MRYFCGLGLLFSLLFIACASAPSALPDASRQIDPDPVQVKADCELYGLRVDLYRNEKGAVGTVDLSSGTSSSAPVYDEWDYALVGIDVGNSLFLDSNGNMSIDLARLYKIAAPFHIQETVAGLFPYTIDYLYSGNTFTRTGGQSDLPDFSAVKDGKTYTVSSKKLDGQVYFDDKSVSYSPSGIHISGKVDLKQVSDSRVERGGMFGNSSYITKDDYDAYLTEKFAVECYGKIIHISVKYGMIKVPLVYQYIRTPEGCWFSDPKGDTHEISKTDNVITVRKNGNVEKTYVLLPVN